MIAVFIFGLMGMSNTKSSFFPLNTLKVITISIQYPGASPAEIEEGVVLKIEDNLRGLVGVDRVTSISQENSASIRVEGLRDANIDALLSDVKNAVDRVPSFPIDMEPPVVSKVENLNDAISFTVSGEGLDLKTLKQIARNIESDLRGISDISQVELSGFPTEEIEIAVRENDLRAYNLTFQEVAAAVSNANILTTGGNIKTSSEEYLIRANNRSYYGKELDFLVVRATPGGNIIRLRDVAEVRDRWNENPDRLYMNGNLAVKIDVKTTNSEDIVLATNNVRDYIRKFNERYDNVQCEVALDQTVALEDRIDLLQENGGLGIFLVLILLGLFLKPSIAFWVAVGLPFSMFGLFIFAPQFMTINVISLFGMILVIGILVDDGIVIAENIYHHYEKGKNPIRAAIDGTLEVGPPIISAILTTMVAFSLFFFLPGVLGDFFGEISAVLILILAISLIEAFLILPAHVSHSRALKKGSQNFLLNRYAERGMLWVRDKVYAPTLRFFLRYKMIGFALPISAFIITIGAMQGGIIKGDFFPPIASEQVFISLKMPQGTTETVTDSIISMIERKTWELHDMLAEEKNGGEDVFRNTIRQIGSTTTQQGPPGSELGGGGGSASQAALTINLRGEEERGGVTAIEVANRLTDLVGPVYGVESLEYNSGSAFGGKPVSVSLVSNNLTEIKAATEDLKASMKAMPQLKDVADNDPQGIKEIRLELKDNAYLLGLNLNSVMQQVRAGFFGQSVQRFQRGRDEIRVWVRYDRSERSSIKFLDEMRIVAPNRSRVPLSEIANYDIVRGEVAINHLDGKREIRVEADVKSVETTAAEMVGSIQTNVMPDILSKYPSVTALYEGQNREFNQIGDVMSKVFPVILLLMYAIIAFTFRSYTQPLMLFLLIPFSFVGVAWGHFFHGMPINMLSVLGIVALIGILVNDGLVLIKKFNTLLRDGMNFDDALYEAGKQRFRAIFLTSITTIAGLAPLIFEPGFSAQFLIPMAISVAYGIGFATLLTLFLLPLIISLNSKMKRTTHWLKTGDWVEARLLERSVKELEIEALEELT